MLNFYYILSIFINLTIITLIFWLITQLEIFFNKNTNHEIKSTVYECGFLTINKNIFPVTLNLILLLFFVIIYEIEFILIIPIILISNTFTYSLNFLLGVLLFIIIITLYLDIWLQKINWVY